MNQRVLSPLRPAARAFTGSTYVLLGFDALRAPGARVEQAGPVLAAISGEVHRPLTRNSEIASRESHRITEPSAYLNGSVAENRTVRS